MSNLLADAAWGIPLDPVCKLVLVCYAHRYANGVGLAWPAVGQVARLTGASERSVLRCVNVLEASRGLELRGYVDRRAGTWIVNVGASYGPGRGRLKLYRVLPDIALEREAQPGVYHIGKGATVSPLWSSAAQEGRQGVTLSGEKGDTDPPQKGDTVSPEVRIEPEPPARARAREAPPADAAQETAISDPITPELEASLAALPAPVADTIRRAMRATPR